MHATITTRPNNDDYGSATPTLTPTRMRSQALEARSGPIYSSFTVEWPLLLLS
jgi:hypothetical protein